MSAAGILSGQMPRAISSPLLRIARSRNPAVRLAKAAAGSILQRLDVVVPARLNTGDVLFVDLANTVGRTIWLRGDYESEGQIKAIIESNLGPGDVFLDVGANVGFFTLTASRIVGPEGAVHSFEPVPQLAGLLRRTVEVNSLTNVAVVEAAVGAKSGDGTMAVMKESAYSHVMEGAGRVDTDHGDWQAVRVRTVSLDEYVAEKVKGRPRVMKMDIEGAEVAALNGARTLLAAPDGPDVICEVGEPHLARFNNRPKDVFDLFAGWSYEALDPETLKPMGVDDLDQHHYNVFFRKTAR